MIGVLPKLYKDELLYSFLSRYAVMSGYGTFRGVAEDLYVNPLCCPNILLLNRMTDDFLSKLELQTTLTKIIMEHTMFKWFVRFADSKRRNRAYNLAHEMDAKKLYDSLPISHNNNRFRGKRCLRYCPECVVRDRVKLGETYFRTYHQIPELRICPIHKCYLQSTDISLAGNVTPAFRTAEMSIPIGDKIVYSENLLEKELSEYLLEVFQFPFDMGKDGEMKDYLTRYLRSTPYMGRSMRNMTKFTKEFNAFYSQVSIKRELWELQKVLTGYIVDAYEVSLMAFFLKIQVQELC